MIRNVNVHVVLELDVFRFGVGFPFTRIRLHYYVHLPGNVFN
jgi:hypothetical protein